MDLPQTISAALLQGYRRSPAWFHQKHHRNPLKLVSNDGHREIVFDTEGKIIKDSDQGTYNFQPPRKTISSNILHFLADMLPGMLY